MAHVHLTGWSRWPSDAGPATESLRRSLHLALLGLVVVGASLLALGAAAAVGTSLRVQVALVTVTEVAVVAAAVRRHISLGSVIVLCVCSVWSAALPDVGQLHTGAAVSSAAYLVLCAGSFRPLAAVTLGLPGVAGFPGATPSW
ncbi:MAG: hypothetical protein JWN22_1440 [Nocardioides sp.]|jgi:hypothetical protein|nr:hypothetical protein [Nocardioides sp.]